MGRVTVAELLDEARRDLVRVGPQEAAAAAREGALLVDVRSDAQRAADGEIPGARCFSRNVLEWRADPASDARDEELSADLDRHVIVVCDEGYASSFAAASLQRLGFARATDLDGGFQAWRAAGLPVRP